MSSSTSETSGVRIAVEGCGHGTLNAIYAAVERSCKERQWDGVDLLIIGGDFQATRNAADLNAMSVPVKYRELGDFHEYYSGARRAPYLTIFVGGNHEASSHLWELYYGGWVAPNIYYMGAANVLRLGPLRIAGMSGIWKGFDYRKQHHERLPFNGDDIKSFYHVREIDVRKLLQLRTQVDIGISHDWPRAIEKYGNRKRLFEMKPHFESESRDGSLGSPAAEYVLDRLRPRYWFSAHMHCRFAAIKQFQPLEGTRESDGCAKSIQAAPGPVADANPDEIDLDLDNDGDPPEGTAATTAAAGPAAEPAVKPQSPSRENTTTQDTEALRAQLPEAFAKRAQVSPNRSIPGQPVPPGITNTTTRFLALDKCLPGRKFLQLMEIPGAGADPSDNAAVSRPSATASTAAAAAAAAAAAGRGSKLRLQYDPEWLAIVRAFHPLVRIGERGAATPPDEGEERYRALIEEHRAWVDEHVVAAGRLDVPDNFAVTAPAHRPGIDPEMTDEQPREWTNPQTAAFCDMLGLVNYWDASEEERKLRMENGPAPAEYGGGGASGGRGRGGWRGVDAQFRG
ncbi:lariat debranching enzyme, C-terminal domain-containing protein [Thermothelomyces heterothallicus CBS 202.75]|uniref:lariat debranching enzyme, C-terminal domain-containing protein n=1 Tax=Thermothelomyces heterothallicus CBS 202.75 TaxID=1149848 RepID=UPI0037426386